MPMIVCARIPPSPPSPTLDSSPVARASQMPNFLKSRPKKGSKLPTITPSQNVTPSTSTLTSTEQSDLPIERIDWALEIANIVKDISEGSPLLAPVKATCALIIRGLELARVMIQPRSGLHESYALYTEHASESIGFGRSDGIVGKAESTDGGFCREA